MLGFRIRLRFSRFYNGMPRPLESNRVCYPKAMMSYKARRHLYVCTTQGRWWHSKYDVVRQCVQSKREDGMPRRCSPTVYAVQRR